MLGAAGRRHRIAPPHRLLRRALLELIQPVVALPLGANAGMNHAGKPGPVATVVASVLEPEVRAALQSGGGVGGLDRPEALAARALLAPSSLYVDVNTPAADGSSNGNCLLYTSDAADE